MMMKQDASANCRTIFITTALIRLSFKLPDEFLKRWLKATNEKLIDEELEGGYNDFAKNLKWTLIENKMIKDNKHRY
jgi:trigger factor